MAPLGHAHPVDHSRTTRPDRPDRSGLAERSERRARLDSDPALMRQRHYESAARTSPRKIPLNLVPGRGVFVRDSRGDEYLGCLAGTGAGNGGGGGGGGGGNADEVAGG